MHNVSTVFVESDGDRLSLQIQGYSAEVTRELRPFLEQHSEVLKTLMDGLSERSLSSQPLEAKSELELAMWLKIDVLIYQLKETAEQLSGIIIGKQNGTEVGFPEFDTPGKDQ